MTSALVATGRHPWKRVVPCIIYQIIGWFLDAAALMAMFGRNYFDLARERGITIGSPDSTGLSCALTTYSPSPGNPGVGPDGYTTVPFLTGLTGERSWARRYCSW